MATAVTTSIVIQFGDEEASRLHLSAEVDGREDGFNGGNTSFSPGDSPYILVYADSKLSLAFVTSSGTLVSKGTTPVEITDDLTFANELTAELSKPPSGGVVLTRLAGVSGGTVSGMTVKIPPPAKAGTNYVAVYRAKYTTTAKVYRLSSVPLTLGGSSSFPVVIVIVGSST